MVEARETYQRKLAAIAFADVVGWSTLIERDDVATLTAWKAVRSSLIEPKIQEYGGRLLEIAGDAVLVEFGSAVAAVRWSIDLQRGLAGRAMSEPSRALKMRVGINVEDVIVDGDKLVGDGVNIAARIQQLADTGEILVTRAVRDHIRNKLEVALEDLGDRRLRNISRTVRLYRIRADVSQANLGSGSEAAPAAARLSIEPADLAEQIVGRGMLPFEPVRTPSTAQGAMVLEFRSAREAAACAFAVRQAGVLLNAEREAERRVALRMCIEEGEAFAHADEASATPLGALAGADEILISESVRDQLVEGLDTTLEDLGERRIEGFARPVRAFRALPPEPNAVAPVDHARGATQRASIAVLPFRNLSGDAANDYLGDLIAEDLLGDLSRLSDLAVISRLSTAVFRGRPYEPQDVGDALAVRYVLTGNLSTSGARLRVAADLSDAHTGQVIWAERFEGSIPGIFELQEQLSQAIGRRVVPYVRQLELQRVRSAQPESLTAYERTLRAIDHFHRSSQQDMREARLLLESAIAADPSYVAPYAWLAHWYVRRVGQAWSEDPQKDASEATRYANMALERSATDAHALTVSGLVSAYLHKDLQNAIEQYNRALTVNPSACSAWLWSTSAYAWLGDGEEAIRRSHRAIELSPLDPQMYMFTSIAGTAHAVAGRYDDAINLCRRSLRQNRMFASTHRILTLSLALSGHEGEAREAAAELLRVEPGLTVSGFLRRYPGSASAHAKTFASALSFAGVPP